MATTFKDKKGIIFDLFGTLTNGQADPDQRIMDEWGLDVDYDTAAKYVCTTIYQNEAQYFDEIVSGLSLPDNKETRTRLGQIFKKDLEGEFIEEDVGPVLNRLRESGYKLGVISDIPNPDYNLLRVTGLEHHFQGKVFSYESGLLKPEVRIMNSMLSQLSLQPDEVVMIGDSHYDMDLAENSGVDRILVDRKEKNPDFGGIRITSLDGLRRYFL